MKTGIKMQVTPERSRKVQDIVSNNGGWEATDDTNIQCLGKPFIFIDSDKTLSYDDAIYLFLNHDYEEVDADLFIRTKGTCEEFPAPNDIEWLRVDTPEWWPTNFIAGGVSWVSGEECYGVSDARYNEAKIIYENSKDFKVTWELKRKEIEK
jgi:hypothetical protein